MPFINSKISTSLTEAQETEIKTRLGQAIQTIPGKSENWLMVGFEPDYKLTGQICDIFKDVLGIAPDHVYVKYQAVSNWGWNGDNF